MTKKEIIWREILFQATKNKKFEFTQKELAEKYSFSLSTVFHALKIPRQSGIIESGGRGFTVGDIEKFLYLWATFRKLKREIVYQTNISKSVRETESEMPSDAVFGAFSAFTKKYQEVPTDYDKVYIYIPAQKLKEIKDRFPPQKGNPNLIVLVADQWLVNPIFNLADKGITPDCQTFVDLWNLAEWYAKDFLNALKEKIFK